MTECEKCGEEAMTFTCKYCGGKYCADHRLPESHDCENLDEGVEKEREENQKWFQEKDVREDLKPAPPPKRSTAQDIIRTFRSNATLAIISVTVLSFFLQFLVPGYYQLIHLSPALTESALMATNAVFGDLLSKTLAKSPWTLATVMLAHGGLFHIFANMVTFYFFGTPLERVVGRTDLLKFYIGAGVLASIGYVLFRNLLFELYGPALFAGTSNAVPVLGPAVGASGAVVAVFAAVAMLYPDAEVLLYFFIPMKIRTAMMLFAGIEGVNLVSKLLGLYIPVFSGIMGGFASSAHLAGLIAGIWYGRKLREKHRGNVGVLDLLGY